jgi:hypothetical protein
MSKDTKSHNANQTARARERRVWVRFPCELDGFCQPPVASGALQWAARVQNVSPGGLALIVDRRFELGALLAIEVQHATGTVMTLLARVVRVIPKPSRRWLLGCSLPKKLKDDELSELLDSQ